MSLKIERSYRVEVDHGHEWRWSDDDQWLKSFRLARRHVARHRAEGEQRRIRIVRVSESVVFEIEPKGRL